MRKNVTALIRIRTSFNNMYVGDEATVEVTPLVQGWIDAGLAEVVAGGTDPAGQGSTQPAVVQGQPKRAGGGVPAGGEPGEGFGASGYGTTAG